jgi:biotin carboxyl carrier protein
MANSSAAQVTSATAPNAKVRALTVRSAQSAHLCFSVAGILEEIDTQLGATIPAAFDLATSQKFYANLGAISATPNDGSLLQFDSQSIYNAVATYRLAALRAEPAKAALDSAVISRQNAFYKKYIDTAGIISVMDPWYRNNPTFSGLPIKMRSLSQLASLAQSQQSQLGSAYVTDKRTGVVRSTTNVTNQCSTTTGQSSIAPGGTIVSTTTALNNQYGGSPYGEDQPDTYSINADGVWTFTWPAPTSTSTTNGQLTENNGKVEQNGTTTNTDYGYRVPAIEIESQGTRAQVSLTDEQYTQYLFGVQVPYLGQIFKNELQTIDLGVRRLQWVYLNTILMSPIPGVVTGVFKNVGEYIRAGEPVLRVENPNGPAWLVGTLIYDGPTPIALSTNVSVTTSLNGAPTSISGTVVAVRGHKAEANEYNVVVYCGGLAGFPLNYHFDFDDTTVTIGGGGVPGGAGGAGGGVPA